MYSPPPLLSLSLIGLRFLTDESAGINIVRMVFSRRWRRLDWRGAGEAWGGSEPAVKPKAQTALCRVAEPCSASGCPPREVTAAELLGVRGDPPQWGELDLKSSSSGCTRARTFAVRARLRSPRRCVSTTCSPKIACAALKHEAAVRLQISSPKPSRRARGEGTNKVSFRQGRRRDGALPTALCAHRSQATL